MKFRYQSTAGNLPVDFHPEGLVHTHQFERSNPRIVGFKLGRSVGKVSDLQLGQSFIHPPPSLRLNQGIRDLITLQREESRTDDPTTGYAFALAFDLLRLLNVVFKGTPPVALIAPDSEGGIRIEWFHNNANIRAVIPRDASQEPYVYVRSQGDSTVRPYSASNVIRALREGILNP